MKCSQSSLAACAVSPSSRAPQRARYKFLNINCCLLAAQELLSTGRVSFPFCSGAVHAKCWLFLHAVKEEGSVTSCPGCLHCVWGRLGGQNRSLSCCCCFSPLTTRAVRFGGTEELSDPRDQPGAPVPRCKRSQGPGDVLLFKSLCSQMSFQIIWMPGAGTVPEGSGPRGLSLVANWGCGCHGAGEEEEEEGNLPLVPLP